MGGAPALPGPRPQDELAAYLDSTAHHPVDLGVLGRALTHRSYAYEAGGLPHNERLEFLGDAVLGVVVTDALYGGHPDLPEGQLAKLRAAVVNMRALAEVARTMDLGAYLLLGRGEESTGGRDKDSILADALEAIIGCVYVSGGIAAASDFVHHLLDPLMARATTLGAGLDWKTSLQELASTGGHGHVEYRLTESGPEHEKVFHAIAQVGGRRLGAGDGRTKKDAEQEAAREAWGALTGTSQSGTASGDADDRAADDARSDG